MTHVQWSSEPNYISSDPIWQSVRLPHLPLEGRDENAIRAQLNAFPRQLSGSFELTPGLPRWQADWGSSTFPEADGPDRWPWLQKVNVPLVTASGGTLRLAARARAKYSPETASVGQWAISAPITVGELDGDPLGAQFVFPGEYGVYMPGDNIELVILADLVDPGDPAGEGLLQAGDLFLYGFEAHLLIFGGSEYDVRYFPPTGGTITMNGLRSNTALFGWRLSEATGTPEPQPTLLTLRNMTPEVRRLTSLAVSVQPSGAAATTPPALHVGSPNAPAIAGTVGGGLLTFPLSVSAAPGELVNLWITTGSGHVVVPAPQTYFPGNLSASRVGASGDWQVAGGAYTLSRDLHFTSESVSSGGEVLLNSLIDGYSGAALGQVPTKGPDGRLVWQALPSSSQSPSLSLDTESIQDIVAAMLGNVGIYNDAAGTYGITLPTPHTNEEIQDVVAALIQAGANVTKTYDDVGNILTLTCTPPTGGGGGSGGPAGTLVRLSGSPAQERGFAYVGSGDLGSSSMYSQEAYYDFLVDQALSFEQITVTTQNASGLIIEWGGVVLATASLAGVADNAETTVTLSHRVDVAAGGRFRLRATRTNTNTPSRLMGVLTTGQNTSTYTEAGITVERWNGADAFAWANSDYVIPRLKFSLGTSVPKGVVGPLDPVDLPGFSEAQNGQIPTKSATGLTWAAPSAGPLTQVISGVTTASRQLSPSSPYPAAFLRRVTTSAPCTVAIYRTDGERVADANRLDTTPTTAPTSSIPIMQATTTPGRLTLALGVPCNQDTLFIRASAQDVTITLTFEEA